jgi:hypothetical protein
MGCIREDLAWPRLKHGFERRGLLEELRGTGGGQPHG